MSEGQEVRSKERERVRQASVLCIHIQFTAPGCSVMIILDPVLCYREFKPQKEGMLQGNMTGTLEYSMFTLD